MISIIPRLPSHQLCFEIHSNIDRLPVPAEGIHRGSPESPAPRSTRTAAYPCPQNRDESASLLGGSVIFSIGNVFQNAGTDSDVNLLDARYERKACAISHGNPDMFYFLNTAGEISDDLHEN